MAQQAGKRKKEKARIVVRIPKILLLVLMLCTLTVAAFFFIRVFSDLWSVQQHTYETYQHVSEDNFRLVTDTEVFDKDDQQVDVISSSRHYIYVDSDDISPRLKKVHITQEGRRLYPHHGVDQFTTARAGLSYVRHHCITQGDSTITQQIIKSTYLTRGRSLKRRSTEILLVPGLEKCFGEGKILEFCCNGSSYVYGCYGVETTGRYCFDKSTGDLGPREAAVSVGVSNRSAIHEPVSHPKNSLRGRNEVPSSLYKQGDIIAEQLIECKEKPLEIAPQIRKTMATENYQTSHAVYCTALQLMKNDDSKFKCIFKNKKEYDKCQVEYRKLYTDESEKIRAGGYRICTTIDLDIQAKPQKHPDKTLDDCSNEKQENGKYALRDTGMVIDNDSNAIVMIMDGRDTDDAYNRGFLMRHQLDSIAKSLIDCAPVFETGYFYPSYVIGDHEFDGGPKNSGSKCYGSVTLRGVLNHSLNTMA